MPTQRLTSGLISGPYTLDQYGNPVPDSSLAAAGLPVLNSNLTVPAGAGMALGATPTVGQAVANVPIGTAQPRRQPSLAQQRGVADPTAVQAAIEKLKALRSKLDAGVRLGGVGAGMGAPVAPGTPAIGTVTNGVGMVGSKPHEMVQLSDGSWASKNAIDPIPGEYRQGTPAPTEAPYPSYPARSTPQAGERLPHMSGGWENRNAAGIQYAQDRQAMAAESEKAQLELDILREQLAQEQLKTQSMAGMIPPSEEVGMVRDRGTGSTSYVSGTGRTYGTAGAAQNENTRARLNYMASQPESVEATGRMGAARIEAAGRADAARIGAAGKQQPNNGPPIDESLKALQALLDSYQTTTDELNALNTQYLAAGSGGQPELEPAVKQAEAKQAYLQKQIMHRLELQRAQFPTDTANTLLLDSYLNMSPYANLFNNPRISPEARAELAKEAWEYGIESAAQSAQAYLANRR